MKIKSLLIANRGEIAVRINETAKKMGIKTYGIKTSKEPNALYLRLVDDVIDFAELWMKFLNFSILNESLKLPSQ